LLSGALCFQLALPPAALAMRPAAPTQSSGLEELERSLRPGVPHPRREALKQWIEEHKKMCRYFSATTDNPSHPKWCIASSPLTYSFRPNTVLTTCTVTCLCGESKDITAYENA